MCRFRKDGSLVWVSVTDSPLRNQDGELLGASCIARDITKRRRADEHREILVGELNHRVKNTLAIVQAIASQTLRGNIPLPNARSSFVARLMALARAHDLLMQANWSGTDLESLINATVAPHTGGQTRFRISGPRVDLKPSAAMTFSLAIHELCTNAAKYGALSVPDGRIDIIWSVSDEPEKPRLQWRWIESGGPAVTPPLKTGFGTSLIKRALAMELLGDVSVAYRRGGIVYFMDAPVPS